MSLFDRLVDEALRNRQDLAPLRVVVEKELLHHDILRVLGSAGLLARLTFFGGSCLRLCYGSNRLSEDLDFAGGADFSRESLSAMAEVLVESFKVKYGLQLEVSEPTRETGNVDTWKLKLQTRPGRRDLPAQRINIDVCSIASHQPRPMVLLNPYGVEMGTGGLILQVESREEIFADKLVAFALRPNRIKHRDLWDMAWLQQQGVKLPMDLVPAKLNDHRCEPQHFLTLLEQRRLSLLADSEVGADFRREMRRFLPSDVVTQTVDKPEFWTYLAGLVDELCKQARQNLSGEKAGSRLRT